MTSIVDFPTDILRYILSIVVYDTFVTNYSEYSAEKSFEDNISQITKEDGDFYCSYAKSKMARSMKKLSLIHPKIKRILVNASKLYLNGKEYYSRLWGFDRSFFATLEASEK